jgi:hypothetical protein
MKEGISAVKKLSDIETIELTQDSRVMAIRWDLIPWSLVLDLDVKESEAVDASTYRAWLIFTGVSEISWPLDNSRLPHGCFLISEIAVANAANDFKEYSFWGMLPTHAKDESVLCPMSKEITIKAKEITSVRSVRMVHSADGFIARATRLNLASDDEMLAELTKLEVSG